MYKIYAFDRQNPSYAWNLDDSLIVSAQIRVSLNGAHTGVINTYEVIPYGTRIYISNGYEFVITGIDNDYTDRMHPNNAGVPLNIYTITSALYYDLSTTINNTIEGTFVSPQHVIQQICTNTAYESLQNSIIGFKNKSSYAVNIDSGTAWEQLSSFISSLDPASDNTTHVSVYSTVYKPDMQIIQREIYARAFAGETKNDCVIDLQSSDIKSVKRTIEDMSVYDAIVVEDKNGSLFNNAQRYTRTSPNASTKLYYGASTDNQITCPPTKIVRNDEFDFSVSTSDVMPWIRSVLEEKTDTVATYEIEFLDSSYLSGQVSLGAYATVYDDIMASPFSGQASTPTKYVISELSVDLISDNRHATLGKIERYIPKISRTGN